MIYITIFITILLLALIEIYFFDNNIVVRPYVNVCFILCIFLICFAGGRVNTGLDYGSYERYFNLIHNGYVNVFNINLEPLYVVANIIAPSYRLLLFMLAIASVYIRYKALKNLKVQLLLFVILVYFATFFLFYDMGVMRQGLSMSLCLLSLPYAHYKEKRFFFIVIIASLFHFSSLTFLIVYFLANKEFSRRFYYILLLLALLFVYLGSTNIIQSNLILKYLDLLGGYYLLHKYHSYFSLDYNDSYFLPIIMKRVIIGIFFIELFKREGRYCNFCENNKLLWTCINSYIVSILFFSICILFGVGINGGRATASLYMLYCLVYEKILSTSRKGLKQVVLFIIFALLSYYSLIEIIYKSSGDTYLNYIFFI